MKKKLIVCILSLVMIMSLFAACAPAKEGGGDSDKTQGLSDKAAPIQNNSNELTKEEALKILSEQGLNGLATEEGFAIDESKKTFLVLFNIASNGMQYLIDTVLDLKLGQQYLIDYDLDESLDGMYFPFNPFAIRGAYEKDGKTVAIFSSEYKSTITTGPVTSVGAYVKVQMRLEYKSATDCSIYIITSATFDGGCLENSYYFDLATKEYIDTCALVFSDDGIGMYYYHNDKELSTHAYNIIRAELVARARADVKGEYDKLNEYCESNKLPALSTSVKSTYTDKDGKEQPLKLKID